MTATAMSWSMLGVASPFAVAVACTFVLLRALHMREHLGRNRVITGFNLYVASTFLMWLLWLHLALLLLLE